MKLGYCCFIAFIFYFGVKYSCLESKGESASQSGLLLSSGASMKAFQGTFFADKIVKKFIDSESSKGNSENFKKRNRKGVKPVFSCIINEYNHKTFILYNEIVLFTTPFYNSCSFSGNAKRGPPQPSFL